MSLTYAVRHDGDNAQPGSQITCLNQKSTKSRSKAVAQNSGRNHSAKKTCLSQKRFKRRSKPKSQNSRRCHSAMFNNLSSPHAHNRDSAHARSALNWNASNRHALRLSSASRPVANSRHFTCSNGCTKRKACSQRQATCSAPG